MSVVLGLKRRCLVSYYYLRPNAARSVAATIISKPPKLAINPRETKPLPSEVVGPQGPKPLAKVKSNAAIPMAKDAAP